MVNTRKVMHKHRPIWKATLVGCFANILKLSSSETRAIVAVVFRKHTSASNEDSYITGLRKGEVFTERIRR